MSGVWDEQLHAMDYLAYAYLQLAQDKQAAAVLHEVNKIQKIEPESFKVAYALSARQDSQNQSKASMTSTALK